jgi:hypothetical protein
VRGHIARSVLLLAATLVLAGCLDAASRANSRVEEANTRLRDSAALDRRVFQAVEDAGTASTSADASRTASELMQEARTAVLRQQDEVVAAKEELSAVLETEVSEGYLNYMGLQIGALDALVELNAATSEYVDDVSALYAARHAGYPKPEETQRVIERLSESGEYMATLQGRYREKAQQAEEYFSDNALGE